MTVKPKPKRRNAAPRKAPKAPKLSRLHAPEHLSAPEWQVALRRQFGSIQGFEWKNLGDDPLFSEFRLRNPASGGRYRISIRGSEPGSNRCDCGDFATNELGTCKHIEFLLGRLSRRRGAARALRRGCRHEFSELWLHYGSERSVRLRPGTGLSATLQADAESLFEAGNDWRLPASRLARLSAFIAACAREQHPLRIGDDVRGFLAQLRVEAERRALLARCYPLGASDPGLASLVRAELLPYQREGVWFLASAGRALLADEMGLGKTVQAIAASELWRRHGVATRVLVVCPTSLKAQWAHELERFAGHGALIIQGNAIERARQYAAPVDWKIASYDSLSRDLDSANAWQPDVLIVDEAQRVKNWDTLAARALKRLISRFAIVLTGTPLENKLEELLSVVQLVDRHRLGPTWRFLHQHQLRDESGRVVGYRDLDRIGETLAPILLRRRKREVLTQLPARQDRRLFVELTALQRSLHDEQADTVARIVQRWRKTRHLSEADQKRLHAALQKMRMVCNSSYLLDRESDEGDKLGELIAWLAPRLAEAGAKAVIFSAWLGTHELIARRLDAIGIGHLHFNGQVPARERARRVERFRNEPACRVLLATDSGGVGLNLQHAASLIVHVDQPWNPALLEQRVGRVYRLGQTRRVEVLSLVARASIEENMLGVLAFKRSLFEGVLDTGASEVRLEGTRLSRFMQGVERLTASPAAADEATCATAHSPTTQEADQSETQPPPAPLSTGPRAAAPRPPLAREGISAPSPAMQPDVTGAVALPPLLHAAAQWLAELAGAVVAGAPNPLVERDPATGAATLRLPLPPPESLRPLLDAVTAWTRSNAR